jgi:SAM-dependent methyltransferase
VLPAPNIHGRPDVYELENAAADPERRIELAMAGVADWEGEVLVDVGAGTGFHLERFHERAAHVIAVEPHAPTRLRALERVARLGLERVSVLAAGAEDLGLRDRSVGVTHSRFAYFFGPGCEPGLAELARVVRAGGTAFVVDNELRSGTFASWLRRSEWCRWAEPDRVEAFWAASGFTSRTVETEWRFDRREDMEAVVRLEFPAALAEAILAEHPGTRVEYHVRVRHRRY